MPSGQPFTALCQRLAILNSAKLADLHTHTTASDGEFTPSQVIALAAEAGLPAVAITDHDTCDGLIEARQAAARVSGMELINGVEISTSHNGRELHLLGYFISPESQQLRENLHWSRDQRRKRYWDYLVLLREKGTVIPQDRAEELAQSRTSLGRRHIAKLLIDSGFAASIVDAFHRKLSPIHKLVPSKSLLEIKRAIELVHGAGGIASLAHPPENFAEEDFMVLKDCGLDAVEAVYPWRKTSRTRKLRDIASRLDLAISGGSDCHGAIPKNRCIGSHGVTREELNILRQRLRSPTL